MSTPALIYSGLLVADDCPSRCPPPGLPTGWHWRQLQSVEQGSDTELATQSPVAHGVDDDRGANPRRAHLGHHIADGICGGPGLFAQLARQAGMAKSTLSQTEAGTGYPGLGGGRSAAPGAPGGARRSTAWAQNDHSTGSPPDMATQCSSGMPC